jgi:hypothetical protein
VGNKSRAETFRRGFSLVKSPRDFGQQTSRAPKYPESQSGFN